MHCCFPSHFERPHCFVQGCFCILLQQHCLWDSRASVRFCHSMLADWKGGHGDTRTHFCNNSTTSFFFFCFLRKIRKKKKQNKTKQKSQTILRYIFFLTYMKTEEELHSPWGFPALGDHGISSTSQPTKSCQNGSALCVLFIALVINLSANKLYNPCWYPHRSKCSIPSFWKRKQ